ncbi:MAG: Asd/ArgC dimerization domain-containing protein [Terriglobia bacterium]
MRRDIRVAMAGASTLLGKEILNVLKERNFPASRVVGLEQDESPEIPILDVEGGLPPIVTDGRERGPFDLVFLASSPRVEGKTDGRTAPFAGESSNKRPFIIDAAHALPESGGAFVSIPFLDESFDPLPAAVSSGARTFISPHASAIALSGLIVPLARHIKLERVIALLFNPASELGARAVDELQKQTVSLLSFQKMPREIFDAQIAFNLAPRLGRKARAAFDTLETRIRVELRQALKGRAPLPSLRMVQVPLFYSLAFSLYVQAPARVTTAQIEEALAGDRVRVLRASRPVPSPSEIQGSGTLLVDSVVLDAEHDGGFWLWAIADNFRLAAQNAVEIAEALLPYTGAA